MHRFFGEKMDVDYVDRRGAYIVAIEGDKVAVVQTPKGYFLLGGGLDEGESEMAAIERECIEEVGCRAVVGRKVCTAEMFAEHPVIGHFHPIQSYYLGTLSDPERKPLETDHRLVWLPYEELKGRMMVEMQNWALNECWKAAAEA